MVRKKIRDFNFWGDVYHADNADRPNNTGFKRNEILQDVKFSETGNNDKADRNTFLTNEPIADDIEQDLNQCNISDVDRDVYQISADYQSFYAMFVTKFTTLANLRERAGIISSENGNKKLLPNMLVILLFAVFNLLIVILVTHYMITFSEHTLALTQLKVNDQDNCETLMLNLNQYLEHYQECTLKLDKCTTEGMEWKKSNSTGNDSIVGCS